MDEETQCFKCNKKNIPTILVNNPKEGSSECFWITVCNNCFTQLLKSDERCYIDVKLLKSMNYHQLFKNKKSELPIKKIDKDKPNILFEDIDEAYKKWLSEQPKLVQEGFVNLCSLCRNAEVDKVDYRHMSCGIACCNNCYTDKLQKDIEYSKKEYQKLHE